MAQNKMDVILFEFCNNDPSLIKTYFDRFFDRDYVDQTEIIVCAVCGQKVHDSNPVITDKDGSRRIWEFDCQNVFCKHSFHRIGKMYLTYDEMKLLTFCSTEDREDYLEQKDEELKNLTIAHEKEDYILGIYRSKKIKKCNICNKIISNEEESYNKIYKSMSMLGMKKDRTYGYSRNYYTVRKYICLNCWNTKIKVINID